MPSPHVAILILCYNAVAWLERCLESVSATRYDNFRVYLLDNGSTDGSLSLVKRRFPWVEVIEHGTNLGFCEGNNRGIAIALADGASDIVLLNPDTWVEPDWLTPLVGLAEAEGIGIAGSVQLDYHSAEFNSWTRTAVPHLLAELRSPENARPWIPVEWVEGSCLLVKREVLDQIGWLDPIYFAFYEEIDLCRRARAHGFTVGLIPASRIHHYRGGSWEADAAVSEERRYRCDRNQFVYELTDPRRGLAGNLIAWGRTLLTKAKVEARNRSVRGGRTLFRIQFDLLRHARRIWQKWRADRSSWRQSRMASRAGRALS